ncbi:hypothetical protein [Phenylobacterium montanum]|uniref:Uncharacterized protein n=1 Tax=Phenylobacterium montanum TaxID=2823693 RepID=A0A975IY76_9CAUL|nr:hypothetical protein [Caulobacter sp. S6]QUD90166.1 hypothetical protein KCG34_10005 [Caulobacter sp. S6]
MIQAATRGHALEDVLYQFTLAHPQPDADDVEAYARDYPQYARELTELAIDLVIEARLRAVEDAVITRTDDDDMALERAISRFQNGLFVQTQEPAATRAASDAPAPIDPFAGLDKAGMRAVARALNANTVFVMKLRDRRIRPETMTPGFLVAAAHALNAANDDFRDYVGAPRAMAGRRRYKSDVTPEAAEKETFEEAVHGSGLSPEQTAFLLGL